jgi:predicted metalloprotease
MRWRDLRRSENIEDRRGSPISGRTVAMGGGGLGILVLLLVTMFLGGDPSQIVKQLPQGGGVPTQQPGGAPAQPRELSPAEKEASDFVAAVLGSTEEVWEKLFAQAGRRYEKPNLVLFSGQVESACGFAHAAMGPFYCPEDRKVYIDLAFFEELDRRFGAAGDFAQAYVIAHEVGHHVQTLLGTSQQVHAARQRVSESEYNQLSVRLELQADFYAGVWAHHAQKYRNILEPGDIEEALNAANAIGDDKLQKQAQGYVVPDSFTHGSSEQRVRWFRKGFQTGDVNQGNTFDAPDL